jgi:putative transposase
MNALCASVNFDAFMRFRSYPSQGNLAENTSLKRSSFHGAEHLGRSRRMRKSGFTEAQIIWIIKEQEAGMPTADVCLRLGPSPATLYKLKSKYGGMEVSEALRLKALDDKNAKLKRLLADTMLDNVVLKDALGKN